MIQTKFKMYEADPQLKALAAVEDERKAALCDLFYDLEQLERKIKKAPGQPNKYERKFNGVVQVLKKSAKSLAIVSAYGENLGRLAVNEAICARVNLYDDLIVKMGFRDGQWRSICLFGIGSQLSHEMDPNLN